MRSLGTLEIDLAALDLVLVQRRWNRIGKASNKETRRVVEVAELCQRDGKLQSNTLFRYDYGKDKLQEVNESIAVFEKARRSFRFDRKGFREELLKRQEFLSRLQGKGLGMQAFFERAAGY